MIEKVVLILLVILAVAAINTVRMRNAVIYLGVYSLLCAFAFLLYQAPDVAIAEAIIGAAFTTVIFLVAIKQQKEIRFYLIAPKADQQSKEKRASFQVAKEQVEKFLRSRELEPKLIKVDQSLEQIIKKDDFDYIICPKEEEIFLYGRQEDRHFDEMEMELLRPTSLTFVRCKERRQS